MYVINTPAPVFYDTDGTPLENGYVYIGTQNLNPETNPIAVYWDSALTQLAAQPLRTVNGYISRNGNVASIYTALSVYSMTIRNRNGSFVYSETSLNGIDNGLRADLAASTGADLVGLSQGGTVQDAISWVTPQEFGAVGDGTTDDTAALVAWLDALGSGSFESAIVGARIGYLPAARYKYTSMLTIPYTSEIRGVAGNSILMPYGISTALNIRAGVTMHGVVVNGVNAPNAIGALFGSITNEPSITNRTVVNQCQFVNFARTASSNGYAVQLRRAVHVTFNDCLFYGSYFGALIKNELDYGFPTLTTFNRCSFNGNTIGSSVITGHDIVYRGCGFEANAENGLYVNYSSTSGAIDNIIIDGGWFENNWTTYSATPATRRLNFNIEVIGGSKVSTRDVYFSNGPDSPKCISFDANSTDYLVDNPLINFNPTGAGMITAAAGSSGTILNFDRSKTYSSYVTEPANDLDNRRSAFMLSHQSCTLSMTFATPGDLSVVYSQQTARVHVVGDICTVYFNIQCVPTHTTASGNLRLTGLPHTSSSGGAEVFAGPLLFSGITKAGYTNYVCGNTVGTTYIQVHAGGTGVATSAVTAANVPSGGSLVLIGSLTYMIT